MDIRYAQILVMLILLATGAWFRDFSIDAWQVALAFAGCLSAQYFFVTKFGLKQVGFLSAVITSIGLSLLLRSDAYFAHFVCGFLCISAKFVLRIRGKHLFNPGMFGVILALLFLPGTWVSAGQWGSDVAYAFWFLAVGSLLTLRSKTYLNSWCFLGSYGLIWFVHRVLWMGYELENFLHQFQSGALLLFAFFMISDPKTTPNHHKARIFYAVFVGAFAYFWQYGLYYQNGYIWALFLCTPLVPILDIYYPAAQFTWKPHGETNNANLAQALPLPLTSTV